MGGWCWLGDTAACHESDNQNKQRLGRVGLITLKYFAYENRFSFLAVVSGGPKRVVLGVAVIRIMFLGQVRTLPRTRPLPSRLYL